MTTHENGVSGPLWGIGRLQIGWIVFQVIYFLCFVVARFMGGGRAGGPA